MHMICKKDLNSDEVETMRISRNPTTVMTADGEVQTREEATENVKELDFCISHKKRWATKHEYEELKEGACLKPALALFLKKVKENWTEKHRNVARKIFLEGGWTHKRLFDIGWSDISQCQVCQLEEGTEKHRLCHCPEWHAVRGGPGGFQ